MGPGEPRRWRYRGVDALAPSYSQPHCEESFSYTYMYYNAFIPFVESTRKSGTSHFIKTRILPTTQGLWLNTEYSASG
jgi:hypothetical protein